MNQKILLEINKFTGKAVFFTDRKKIADFTGTIKGLPKKSIIIIREYDLNAELRKDFAKKIINLARPLGLKVIIGKDISLARELKADGVHFSDLNNLPLKFLKKKSFSKQFIFSVACHSFKSLIKYKRFNPTMLFISPIFPTTSHSDAKTIGLRKLAQISLKTKNDHYAAPNIYALGGINGANIKSVRKLQIAGFGAIDLFK